MEEITIPLPINSVGSQGSVPGKGPISIYTADLFTKKNNTADTTILDMENSKIASRWLQQNLD